MLTFLLSFYPTDINLDEPEADNYTDLVGKTICPKKSQLLKDLKASVKNKVKQHYYHEFYINWERNAIDCEQFKQHSDYLTNFNAFVVTRVKKLIDKFTKHKPILPKRICNNDLVQVLQLESDFLANIAQYQHLINDQKIIDGSLEKSLSSKLDNTCWLIEEEMDSGKSALLASIYYEYYKDSIVIGQFINEQSRINSRLLKKNIEKLLAWKLNENSQIGINNLFTKANEKSKKIIILIDNLHFVKLMPSSSPKSSTFSSSTSTTIMSTSLSSSSSSSSSTAKKTSTVDEFDWIFQKLPNSIHIICSISPNALNLKNRLFKRHNIKFSIENGVQYIQKIGRELTIEEEFIVKKILKEDGSWFLAQLIKHNLVNDICKLREKDIDADETFTYFYIKELLNFTEEHLGEDLQSVLMKTITSSAIGLTEVEILDILSLNNDALLLTIPQSELTNLLRFPYSVWLYVKKYLKPLFTINHFKGRELWIWRNEEIRKIIKSLYFKTAESIQNTHNYLADYFGNKWINHKPLVLPEKSIQIIEPHSCCRYLTPHPLIYSEYLYNYRRIAELGQHLLHSVDIDVLKYTIYFNLESLISLIQALGVHFLIEEIDLVLRHVFDTELHVLRDTIIACHEILEEDTLQLPVEIIGRLRNIEFGKNFPNISDLMLQCVQWCDSNTKPLLVPLSSWLPDPRRKSLIKLNIQSTKAIINRKTQFIVTSTVENTIKMYHISSKRLIRTSYALKSHVIFLLDCKDDRIAASTADGSVILWNTNSGKFDAFLKEPTTVRTNVMANIGDLLLLGNNDGSIHSFNLNTLEVVDKLKHHSDAIIGLNVSKDEEYLVCGKLINFYSIFFF